MNHGSLECFILLQMLGQRVAVAEIMVGFKTDQGNTFILVCQVNQLLDFGFVVWQKFVFVCLE